MDVQSVCTAAHNKCYFNLDLEGIPTCCIQMSEEGNNWLMVTHD